MYANGRRAGVSGPSSSLMLQQHLVNHYRHLQNARSVVDSGQLSRGRKRAAPPGPARGSRHLLPSDFQTTPSTGSTGTLQLVERILNDIHQPPQYYAEYLPEHSDKSSEFMEGLHDLRLCQKEPDNRTTDDDSILDKIDSYLADVRTTSAQQQQRQLSRQRFTLTRAAPRGRLAYRPALNPRNMGQNGRNASQTVRNAAQSGRGAAQKRRLTGQRLPRSLAAQRQLQAQILRAHLSPEKFVSAALGGQPSSVMRPPGAAVSVTSSDLSPLGRRLDPTDKCQYDRLQFENDSEDDTLVSGGPVPPLSISPDSDHDPSWPRKQQNRSTFTTRPSSQAHCQLASLGRVNSALDGGRSGSRSRSPERTGGQQGPKPASSGRLSARETAPPRHQRATYRCQVDEQKYVQFLSDVTSDILARGAFTNCSLKQIMRAHVENCRGRLETSRMVAELEKLRQELGVPADSELDGAGFGYGLSQEPAPGSVLPVQTQDAALPPGGDTVAPPDGRVRNVSRLLGDLSLDDSIARTILRCCGDTADAAGDVSVGSDEIRECLNGSSLPKTVT